MSLLKLWSLDTFELFYNDVRFTDSDYDGAGSGKIAWQSDRREKFKVVDDLDLQKFTKNSSDNRRLPGVDDEDFIVWMRTAGLPTFKKLKYVINKALNNGDKLTVAAYLSLSFLKAFLEGFYRFLDTNWLEFPGRKVPRD